MADAQTRRRSNFSGALAFGLWAPILTGAAYGWWKFPDITVNDGFVILGIDIGLCVLLPILYGLVARLKVGPIVSNVFSCLFGSLIFNALMMTFCATFVLGEFERVDMLKDFVQQDFAWVDTGNTGKVTNTQLQAITRAHDDINSRIRNLESAESQIDFAADNHTTIDNADRYIDRAFDGDEAGRLAARKDFDSMWPTKAAIDAAKQPLIDEAAALRTKLLPDDRYQRVAAASWSLCLAGHKVSPNPDGGWACEATREDLLNYEQKLEHDYPTWSWIIHKTGAILLIKP